ncbi:YlaI family protein [Alkalihalobacillus sp. CinArs1]|uniref:YlaI family protein n=1 Tax=Alkalihalobacillus sp. CinArs1 TaxID=2995314 RepID=UPI0022DDF322|nr:YlaI family protein [Alkalihalobacillus sp. CinArs1]
MRVKCVLCDKIESIDSGSPLAKKLRNRPIHTYMCDPCYDRIESRTKERKESGDFKLYHKEETDDEW